MTAKAKKWRYFCSEYQPTGVIDLENYLNSIGEAGWELIQIRPLRKVKFEYIFKKEIIDENR